MLDLDQRGDGRRIEFVTEGTPELTALVVDGTPWDAIQRVSSGIRHYVDQGVKVVTVTAWVSAASDDEQGGCGGR